METHHIEACDCYSGVDRMINEGLGGGHLYYEYDLEKFEPKQAPKPRESGEDK